MGVNSVQNDGMDREINGGYTTEGYAPPQEVQRHQGQFHHRRGRRASEPEFPALSVSKIRYLERRRLINLSRTRGGYSSSRPRISSSSGTSLRCKTRSISRSRS